MSAFRGKGKRSGWQTWDIYPDVSDVFKRLGQYPPRIADEDFYILEKLVVIMYDHSSACGSVDETKFDLFARKQKTYDTILPNASSLRQHTKRAVYQAACVWNQALVCQPEMDNPEDWGWKKAQDEWQVAWTILPPIAESCPQLTKCGSKTKCSERCKCHLYRLPCTALCSCNCMD